MRKVKKKQDIHNIEEKKTAGMLKNTVKNKPVLAIEPRYQALLEICIVHEQTGNDMV